MKAVNNFNFANITRIVFGKGQIAQLPTLIPKDRIVYMTYGGGSIKRNGTYDQVMTALKGYEIHEFGGIEANPDFDTLVKAVAEIKKLDMDRVYLLAVGGGSVADGTYIFLLLEEVLLLMVRSLLLLRASGIRPVIRGI